MKKNKLFPKLAIALCGVTITTVSATAIINNTVHIINATTNHKGYNNWIQYGTLKYALKGPSGIVYPAGTQVARYMGTLKKPTKLSYPGRAFLLSLSITPSPVGITQFGGGEIAETYVNYEDWQTFPDPDLDSFGIDIVESSSDMTDLASGDFHPVDSSKPDVPYANTDKLHAAYNNLDTTVKKNNTKKDYKIRTTLTNRYFAATAMGVTQESVDKLTQDITKAIAQFKKTGHLVGYNKYSISNSNTNTNKSSKNKKKSKTITNLVKHKVKTRKVRLLKSSYCYDHNGKRVSDKKLTKGIIIQINRKIYHIKGKKYYRIIKNLYIRAVNVVKK